MSDEPDIIYFNGEFIPKSRAPMSIEDRGTMFSDGVYEVTRFIAGRGFMVDAHLARLRRSLGGVRIPEPGDLDQLPGISERVVTLNGSPEALVYWQVTRGAAKRNHVIPEMIDPTVLVLSYPAEPINPDTPPVAKRTWLIDDPRWKHCWIKSLMLLPNVLARQEAMDHGCDDAIFQRDGLAVESTSSNLFVVIDGELYTHPNDGSILCGITRQVIFEIAKELGVTVQEQPIPVDTMLNADEVFFSSSNVCIAAVTYINEKPIRGGTIGQLTNTINRTLLQRMTAIGSAT